jgi:hypothetical protein
MSSEWSLTSVSFYFQCYLSLSHFLFSHSFFLYLFIFLFQSHYYSWIYLQILLYGRHFLVIWGHCRHLQIYTWTFCIHPYAQFRNFHRVTNNSLPQLFSHLIIHIIQHSCIRSRLPGNPWCL